jgi:hypothetical protein
MRRDDIENLTLFILCLVVVPGVVWFLAGYRVAWLAMTYSFLGWLFYSAGQRRERTRHRPARTGTLAGAQKNTPQGAR